jgi:hypothetical protein
LRKTVDHHRRPVSIGGTDSLANISLVVPRLHMHWHTLFGNMNAEQICNHINQSHWKPEGVTVVCRFINGTRVKMCGGQNSKKKSKCEVAWKALFGNLTFQEVIGYINSMWLDSSYHFYVIR